MIFVMLAKSGLKVKPETIKISGALLYLSLRLPPSDRKSYEVSFPPGESSNEFRDFTLEQFKV